MRGSQESNSSSYLCDYDYDLKNDELAECSFNRKTIQDDQILKIGLQAFHLNNIEEFLGISYDEICAIEDPIKVVNSDSSTFEEILRNSFELDAQDRERTLIIR